MAAIPRATPLSPAERRHLCRHLGDCSRWSEYRAAHADYGAAARAFAAWLAGGTLLLVTACPPDWWAKPARGSG